MKENLTTLIVDDDKIALLYLERVTREIEILGKIICAEDGIEALKKLDLIQSETKRILILLDINMPRMNGWEFLEALSERGKNNDIMVIIVTSSTAQTDKERAKSYQEVIGFVEKPLETQRLKEILNLFDNNLIVPKGTNN